MSSAANSRRRVAITGMGVVCPLGNSPSAMWEALSAGRSGVGALTTLPQLDDLVHYGGEARDFTGAIGDFGELDKALKKSIRKALKVMCRETMMAVAVAQQAVADAGFGEQPMDAERSGVVFGSDYMLSPPGDFTDGMIKCGAQEKFEYPHWGQDGLREMNPLWMLKYLPNMPGSHIAIMNDLRGPNNSLTLREISGMMAIREAAQTIERGHADCMIAGATGTRIHSFKTIHAVQTEQLADPSLDPAEASRPFDANRTGMVVGEGSGAIVLEELETARARGATIYGEVIGTGSSVVASAAVDRPHRVALANAARSAVTESKLDADQIGHINAHGLATTEGDTQEAQALGDVLGSGLEKIPVVAQKSYMGNLGAGSSVVEVVGSLLAMQGGELYKTLNFETADSNAPLAVSSTSQLRAGESFLKLSVTPQAQAAALVISRV